jgi:hypothetical protein
MNVDITAHTGNSSGPGVFDGVDDRPLPKRAGMIIKLKKKIGLSGRSSLTQVKVFRDDCRY